jgi:uncharacterized protein with ParB-like and HNH nuclease domain
MSESKLVLKSINQLLECNFFIPAYQRGYRWTPQQVNDLLNDIWEFHKKDDKSKEEFYCLQPLVVKKVGNEYALIDGQQRLTTIFLILTYLDNIMTILGKKKYSFRFETRKDSETFLQNIDIEQKEHNIDYYHICEAYKVIETWFSIADGNTKLNFINTLLNDENTGKNVKVIWYEVEENTNQIEIFTRLNMGKIPLTNAELIKALFLKSSNFKDKQNDEIRLKQLIIATEWDRIEYALQNDAFWYFISNNSINYATRIEYIFDLISHKKAEDEKYFTFHKFNGMFDEYKDENNNPEIDVIWLTIKKYFLTFEEWFNERELYHLVGYLVATGCQIEELKTNSEQSTKTEFKLYLHEKIRKLIDYDISTLEYKNPLVKSVLLLFNIQTIISNTKSNIRFPFDKFKTENWDIEHIRSQTTKSIFGNQRKAWAKDILQYFTGTENFDDCKSKIPELQSSIKEFAVELLEIIETEKIIDADFDNTYKKLQLHFNEDKEPENINSIANLALLDSTTNRSYKNAYFSIKRSIILKNDKNGTFVPICTKNLFLKSYSKRIGQMMHWEKDDAKDYMNEIISTLSIYKL